MPRPLRLKTAGFLHHVICEGNDRLVLFKDREDHEVYLTLLNKARGEFRIHIYNYLLMDTHVQLLVEPLEDGHLSKFMELVSKEYAKYFNQKYKRRGHVFGGRFKSFVVQADRYYLACAHYMDTHAVAIKKAAQPEKYAWSGHRTLSRGGRRAIKLDQHPIYKNLGPTAEKRQAAYRALIMNFPGERLDLLNRNARILGDREFKRMVRAAR